MIRISIKKKIMLNITINIKFKIMEMIKNCQIII